MKKPLPLSLALLLAALAPAVRAEFLYQGYLIPGFDGQPNTEFSYWDVFYSANQGINYPDVAAPNGVKQAASIAGFTPPAGSAPGDPLAYWNAANPTILQNGADAFVIGAATAGNIYSFAGATAFDLSDTTPYTAQTAVFQFQTEGTPVDFNSIKLVYNNGSGEQVLSPSNSLREYRAGTSAFAGYGNRTAVQWNLTGLNITSYKIVWQAEGSSMSFQEALLDTAATYQEVVPGSRTYLQAGAGNWSTGANWQEGTTSVTNGNVRFANASASRLKEPRSC